MTTSCGEFNENKTRGVAIILFRCSGLIHQVSNNSLQVSTGIMIIMIGYVWLCLAAWKLFGSKVG
jgi:hypothetical protein